MKINYKGQEIDAHALVMTKENALEILKGKKNVEFRRFSPKYDKMFTDFKQIELNNMLKEQGREEECKPPFRTDIGAVHFYNYNNTWHLDVLIDEIGIVEISQEGAQFLADEYGCHELDDQWQQFTHLPAEQRPFMFYLHIEEIVGHEGL